MKDILISVIVPVYNVETYIEQCIRSICDQSYQNLDIILVDDGSQDCCPEICDAYSAKDSRIKVIHKRNGGLVSARKSGIQIARGDYITYVDSDDWIEKDMYADMVKILEKNAVEILIEDYILDTPSGKSIVRKNVLSPGYYDKQKLEGKFYSRMLYSGEFFKFGVYPCVWNKLFKREVLIDVQFGIDDEISMGEDVAVTYKCILKAKNLYLSDKYHYHYRSNPEAMTKKYDADYLSKVNVICSFLKETLVKESRYKISEQVKYYTYHMLLNGIYSEYNPKNRLSVSKKFEKIQTFVNNDLINELLMDKDYTGIPFIEQGVLKSVRRKQYFISLIYYLILLIINQLKKLICNG